MDTTARDAGGSMSRAIWLMTLSAVIFGFMAITIRYASKQLHPFEIAFFRNVFGFLFAAPLLLRHGTGLLRTDRLPLYFGRCALGIVSMLAGFWALVNLPLAQAVALSYSTPLFVTIGAVLVLGEVVGVRRWSAVLIGFVGVLVIVRPLGHDFTAGALIAVLAAAMSAAVAVSIKILSRTERPDAIVLYTTLIWVPMSFVPALFFWEWPNAESWMWVTLAGFFGTTAHMCWTRALKIGDASAITPISFVQLPVVAILAYMLFDERLDRWTALGSCIIFASNIYIAQREARLHRRAITDPEIRAEAEVLR